VITKHMALLVGRWSLVVGRWSLVVGRWSLVVGRWSLVVGRWSLVVGRWSLVVGRAAADAHPIFQSSAGPRQRRGALPLTERSAAILAAGAAASCRCAKRAGWKPPRQPAGSRRSVDRASQSAK